jgi:hypothetical protein
MVEGQAGRVEDSFALMAAIVGVVSLPLAAGNLVAMLASVHFNVGGMANPLILLRAGRAAAPLWRWSMVLDITGYYLPVVPLIFVLRMWLRHRGQAWVEFSAFCLLAYCLIGAIGGAMLATVLPTLITQYAANPGHDAAVRTVFTGYTDGIYRGAWNLLEEFLAGIGWAGFGIALRPSHRRLGAMSIALAVACLVDSAGTALNIDPVASAGLTMYLILAPSWACWLGIDILNKRTTAATRAGSSETGLGMAVPGTI